MNDASSDDTPVEAREALEALWRDTRSLMLATVDAQGHPEVSYTPFVRGEDGDPYIFVSALARHTGNLLQRPRVSVMLVEDEAAARQIFARRRLSYRCVAEPVPQNDARWEGVMGKLAERHGEVVSVLRGLPDFTLFRLRAHAGNLVIGFGQAYRLKGEALDELEPVGPARQ